MPKYTLFYRGGKPSGRAEAETRQPHWNLWFRELGDRLVDRGAPARSLGIATKHKLSEEILPTTGYSVIEAASEEEALRIAQSCPVYREGGTVEVARFVTPTPL